MSHVLTPSVEGAARPSLGDVLKRGTLWLHVVGTTAGGLVLGAMFYFLSALASANRAVVLIAILFAIAGAASTLAPKLVRWPERDLQVPVAWAVTKTPTQRAWQWGMMLGGGLLTPLVVPGAFYAFLMLSFIQGRGWETVIPGITYGATRGAMVVAVALWAGAQARTPPHTFSPASLLPDLRSRLRWPLAILVGGGVVVRIALMV
jgi:hypothetical protein